jgi:Tfp pilus assembly protein PilX
MIYFLLRPSARTRENAVALLIVLAFLVLLAGLTVAYLSRTTTDRQVAHGSFNDAKSDQLARSALDIIVADLKQEIVNGSTSSTVNNVTIYIPTSAANLAVQTSGTPTSGTPIPNLIRRSVQSDNISLPGVASRASALNSAPSPSGTPAKKGEITTARWNKHYLIPRRTPAAGETSNTVYTDPDASFVAPDWVFVDNTGPTIIGNPSNAVLGRYAYAIFDEGGLIDANVGGYPSPTPSPAPTTFVQAIGRKGSIAFADLTVVGMSTGGLGDIAGWRNYASIQPAGAFGSFTFDANAVARYVTYVTSNANGFLGVDGTSWTGRTNQEFVNRQSLTQFRGSSGFTQDALQYLGTFSRELDYPTWSPASSNATNPDFRTLRVSGSFVRNDGTTANVGEPLVNKRFLLSRLNWLTYKGPSAFRTVPAASPSPAPSNADYDVWALINSYGLTSTFLSQGTDANILKYFGLAWDSTNERWNYVGHSGGASPISSIAILSSLTATREPDFFELLQAGILTGSLGDSMASTFPIVHQQSKMLQILTIGANLISQVTVDSYPTRIACSVGGVTMEAVGSERLPYINMLGSCAVGSSLTTGGVSWFLIPNIWDPYRNTSDMTTAPLRPAIEITVNGRIGFGAVSGGTTTAVSTTVPSPTSTPITALLLTGSSTGGRDGLSGGYPESAKLDTGDLATAALSPTPSSFNAYPFGSESSNGASASIAWRTTNALSGSNRYVIMRAGHPGSAISAGIIGQNPAIILNPNNSTSEAFQVTLDYQSPTNTSKWYAYSYLQGNNDRSTWLGKIQITDTNSIYASPTVTPSPTATPYTTKTIVRTVNTSQITPWAMSTLNLDQAFIKSDPRSTRFNSVIDTLTDANASPTPIAAVIKSIWPNGTSPANLGSGSNNPAIYAQNASSYTDADGQFRMGDNGPALSNPYAAISPSPSPTTTSQFGETVRPLVLNRPFRSVGEMGYAFRDQPFKSLDFLTNNSADTGLLDLFCVNDNTNSSRLRAGVVNLNSKQSSVLASLIARVLQKDDSTSSEVSSTNANTIGANLASRTSGAPMTNRGDTVSDVASDSTLLLTKTQHEAIIRAVSDGGQTRTWNLMIDLIAQSGRYPPTATALSDFVVEGEKRYWLHVAIDRFTGEVIDQQLEEVFE